MAQTNPPFMSGVPELLVLRLLARQEMYGYEIVRAVKLVTQEAISMGEGVIYPVLHGLEKGGSLKAKTPEVRPRRGIGGGASGRVGGGAGVGDTGPTAPPVARRR